MLIYTDQIEAYERVVAANIFDYAATVFNDLACKQSASGSTSSASTEIATGDITDRAIRLFRLDRAYPTAFDNYGSTAIMKRTSNPGATHWASFDFKWQDSQNVSRIRPAAFFGFNEALVTDSWSSRNAAPIVCFSKDGLVHVGGNASSSSLIPEGTLVHIDIEILTAAAQINVYVNRVLAVSSPTDLSWLLGGLTALGPCISARPISSETTETAIGLNAYYDNLTFYDATGPSFNARLTESVVYKRLPLAAQVDANFTNEGGATSTIAALSDYTGAVFNTATYAKSPAANDLADTFTVDASPIGALDTIRGVSVVNLARRNAMGARHIEARIVNGADVLDINHTPQTPLNFVTARPCFAEKNPNGSGWTLANLATTKFGYVVKAS